MSLCPLVAPKKVISFFQLLPLREQQRKEERDNHPQRFSQIAQL
jgi:hypothetical protein